MKLLKGLVLFLMLSYFSSYSQIKLPSVEYDTIKVIKTNTLNKKEFFKSGKLICEVFYPMDEYQMGTHCGMTNAIHDSIYFYYSPSMEYAFSKSDGNKITKWNGKLKELHTFYPDGKKWVIAKTIQNPNYFANDIYLCSYYDLYKIGEYIVYKPNGDTSEYIDFTTGVFKDGPILGKSKKLMELQQKANEIVKANFGEAFYNKYVRINYGLIKPEWNREKIYSMNPPLKRGAMPPDNTIEYVDLSYNIYFSESEQYNLINIRLDYNGNIINVKNYYNKNSTFGLLKSKPFTLITKEEALLLIKPIIKEIPNFYSDLIWKEDEIVDGKGSFYYQVLFNKVIKERLNSRTLILDEILINATTKEVLKKSEFSQTEESAVEPIQRFELGGKFGFKDETQHAIEAVEAEESVVDESAVESSVEESSADEFAATADDQEAAPAHLPDETPAQSIIPAVYEFLPENYEDFMIAKKDGKFGYITYENKIILPFEFDKLSFIDFKNIKFQDEILIGFSKNGYSIYNRRGRKVSNEKFDKYVIDENNNIKCYLNNQLKATLNPAVLIGQ